MYSYIPTVCFNTVDYRTHNLSKPNRAQAAQERARARKCAQVSSWNFCSMIHSRETQGPWPRAGGVLCQWGDCSALRKLKILERAQGLHMCGA